MKKKSPVNKTVAWHIARRNGRKKHRLKKRAFFSKWLREIKDVPCADCGNKYPSECMDFDHMRDKKYNVGNLFNGAYCLDTVRKEMEKCEIVCANCHRIRTKKRTDSLKPLYHQLHNPMKTCFSPDLFSGEFSNKES